MLMDLIKDATEVYLSFKNCEYELWVQSLQLRLGNQVK